MPSASTQHSFTTGRVFADMVFSSFSAKSVSSPSFCRKDKELRDELSEAQIDKMVMDSFPASDPPSTY